MNEAKKYLYNKLTLYLVNKLGSSKDNSDKPS
jgi:hypothetical protein